MRILNKNCLDEASLNRFMTEIWLLSELDHSNILQFFESFEDEKRYYIVTELCTGGELFQTIEKMMQ